MHRQISHDYTVVETLRKRHVPTHGLTKHESWAWRWVRHKCIGVRISHMGTNGVMLEGGYAKKANPANSDILRRWITGNRNHQLGSAVL